MRARVSAQTHFNGRKHGEKNKTKIKQIKTKQKRAFVAVSEPAQAWSDPSPIRHDCVKKQICKKVKEFFFQHQKLREYMILSD